ncbi:hypothetical protein D3227_06610 [Mesorhizobium waimense]|uniref:Uncharacterized protein n=1 Tax=Mesorhizobium waimense TaxID=1300307 RepID=A0A3A5L022_9HYPH|nr:hypothetical protein [Mesorhizobium waimense]RJT41446.1 hypothetical protein D3227_06610 [Mesorhizobium waimense]
MHSTINIIASALAPMQKSKYRRILPEQKAILHKLEIVRGMTLRGPEIVQEAMLRRLVIVRGMKLRRPEIVQEAMLRRLEVEQGVVFQAATVTAALDREGDLVDRNLSRGPMDIVHGRSM